MSSVKAHLRSASALKNIFNKLPPHITDALSIPREKIGPAGDHLLSQLLDLYWAAVERDLEHITRALRVWQQERYDALPEELDPPLHGFDSFPDQVSGNRRQSAWTRASPWKPAGYEKKKTTKGSSAPSIPVVRFTQKKCGLGNLANCIAEAKFDTTRKKHDKNLSLADYAAKMGDDTLTAVSKELTYKHLTSQDESS
ncbi:unnamed protein product [Clonostachys rhizophaga]|uniref:Uncharacterized protein n=1 Tax=Clonostachys rhizophaga TaxID=160324 RepID=A0A9N9YKW2_9HYPO|nr:unnamed protein product [Clonostachys rhizophaga]